MPDLDEFEQISSQWRSMQKRFIDDQNTTSTDIADAALGLVQTMLGECGGCPLLPRLANLLWQYRDQLLQSKHRGAHSQQALAQICQQLHLITQQVADRRIDMVAIRSALTLSITFAAWTVNATSLSTLQELLAGQIVKDLIRHCGLDAARARSIGTHFPDGDTAYQFYQDVMASVEPQVKRLALLLAQHPDGQIFVSQPLTVLR